MQHLRSHGKIGDCEQSKIIIGELKIEWKHIFRTFLKGFIRKNYLDGLQKRTKQKAEPDETVRRADNLFNFSTFSRRARHHNDHMQDKKSVLLDNYSPKSQQLVPNYFLYTYKCPDFHLQKI